MKNRITQPLIILFIVGITSVVFIGCRKKTKGQFEVNKYEYAAGEMLDFTNLKPKKKQFWSITNESGDQIDTIPGAYPQFVLSPVLPDGLYHLNLFDNKTEFINNVKTFRPFVVKTIRSPLKISASSSSKKEYTVHIDGVNVGSTTNGSLVLKLPIGVHFVKISFKAINEAPIMETVVLQEGSDKWLYI